MHPAAGSPTDRVTVGMRRLALVAGIGTALLFAAAWIFNFLKAPDGLALLRLPAIWVEIAVGSLIVGLLVWGTVRVLAWVASGFFRSTGY